MHVDGKERIYRVFIFRSVFIILTNILNSNTDVSFKFYLKFWNTTRISIPARNLLYKIGRLLTGIPAQQKGITARWY